MSSILTLTKPKHCSKYQIVYIYNAQVAIASTTTIVSVLVDESANVAYGTPGLGDVAISVGRMAYI